MPNMDKTGPKGTGSTGKGFGGCCERRLPSETLGIRFMCRRAKKPSRSRARRVGTGMFAEECCMGADAVLMCDNDKAHLEANIKALENAIKEMKKKLSELH